MRLIYYPTKWQACLSQKISKKAKLSRFLKRKTLKPKKKNGENRMKQPGEFKERIERKLS
jgi:hypothetical protein